MPSPFAILSTEAIAYRLEFHRDTVTLEAVTAIYARLSIDAHADGHEDIPAQAHDAVAAIGKLIADGKPRGLTDSARQIRDVDALIETALVIRDATASAYDRYHAHTDQAKEAVEILLAYSELIDAADFQMRTGVVRSF